MSLQGREEPVALLVSLPQSRRRTYDAVELPFTDTGSRPLAVAHGRRLQSRLKIIVAILEPQVLEKIRTHLGLQARAPPRAPARG